MAGWRQTSTAAWSKASHALWWGPDVVGALGRFLEKTEEKWTKTSCLARKWREFVFFFKLYLKMVFVRPKMGWWSSFEQNLAILPFTRGYIDISYWHLEQSPPQCCWVYDVESLKKYPIECSNIMDHPPSRSVKSGRRFTVIRSEVNFHLHPKELTNNDIHWRSPMSECLMVHCFSNLQQMSNKQLQIKNSFQSLLDPGLEPPFGRL